MKNKSRVILLLVGLVCLSLACNFSDLFTLQQTATVAPSPTTPHALPTLTRSATKTTTPTSTSTNASSPQADSCEITALTSLTAYTRPSLAADVFGTVPAGMKLIALVRAADNWFGFDPGVAQAGNAGVFRYRWVQATANQAVNPDCSRLRLLDKIPLPGICYVMLMGSTPVRQAPSTGSALVYTFTLGDYAQALGESGDWIKVNLAISNIDGLAIPGWVSQDLVGLNGCPAGLTSITP